MSRSNFIKFLVSNLNYNDLINVGILLMKRINILVFYRHAKA